MKEALISYQTAMMAKEKGFRENCQHFYCINATCNYIAEPYEYSFRVDANQPGENFGYGITYSAPSQSLLQKWLREVHKIDIEIICYIDEKTNKQFYDGDIYSNLITEETNNPLEFDTYEEALEDALRNSLELIKTV